MPELAEVEYFRKQWDAGRHRRITAVHLHPEKRILRGIDTDKLRVTLTGAKLLDSQAHGKQMLFRFSKGAWIGIHLGMTGKLEAIPSNSGGASSHEPPYNSRNHDHLILQTSRHALVFHDPRQFGRILFHLGKSAPPWWTKLPPPLLDPKFTLTHIEAFLRRHRASPIKAALLMQAGFPGIGNWMADEVLWQSGIHPSRPGGKLLPAETKKLLRIIKSVSRTALRTVGMDYGDLPRAWLFDRRWKRGGHCPKDGAPLRHATIAGRTTCWCPTCQQAHPA